MQNVRTANWFLYGTVLNEVYSTNPDKKNIKKERQKAEDCSRLKQPNRQKSLLLQEVSNANKKLLADNPTE